MTILGDHAIYCAIMSPPSKSDGLSRLQTVLDKMPKALDCQALDGMTPLHLAFQLRRYSAAKYLIERGANQALRDKHGRNILHHLLDAQAGPLPSKMFEAMWDLIDPELVQSLATERMRGTESDFPLFHTPLAYWLTSDGDHNQDVTQRAHSCDLLRAILNKSNGAGLGTMDGAGNYPIHTAIKKTHPALARVLLQYDPEILSWENATGKTALDILDREFERETLDFAHRLAKSIGVAEVVYGVPGAGFRADEKAGFWQEVRGLGNGKRKLVSVFEANQLVRSLDVYQEARERREREELRREGQAVGSGAEDEHHALKELGWFLRNVRSEESYEVEEFKE